MHRLTGIGVSPGVVVGRAVLLMQRPHVIRFPIGPERVAERSSRGSRRPASGRASSCSSIQARVARGAAAELGYLFDAQLLMLDDPMLVAARARHRSRSSRSTPSGRSSGRSTSSRAIFEGIEDPYLRERRGDVADVVGRLRMNLRPARGRRRAICSATSTSRSVLIADELTPSLAAQVDWRKIRGFATDAGSRTYHTAILARSLARAGRRRAARRERAHPAGRIGRHRRRRPARSSSIRRRSSWSEAAQRSAARTAAAPAPDARARPRPGDDRRRRARSAAGQHRAAGRRRGRAGGRRRGHRPVSIRVPAGRARRPSR